MPLCSLCAFSFALISSDSRASSILLSSGLVGVTLILMLTGSPHPSWGPISFVVTRFTHSGLSWVSLVEAFDCEGCIFEVVCWVPSFIVFGRISSPLGSILQFSVMCPRVDDFFEFVFLFSCYFDRRRRN